MPYTQSSVSASILLVYRHTVHVFEIGDHGLNNENYKHEAITLSSTRELINPHIESATHAFLKRGYYTPVNANLKVITDVEVQSKGRPDSREDCQASS